MNLMEESMPILNDVIQSEISKLNEEYAESTEGPRGVIIDKSVSRPNFNLDTAPFIHSRDRTVLNNKMQSLLMGRLSSETSEANSSLQAAETTRSKSTRSHQSVDASLGCMLNKKLTVHDLGRSDERRIALQILFLFVLRHHCPKKYPTLESFLAAYPSLRDQAHTEQVKLHSNGNWFDLALLTIKPQNNKSFLMRVIPRMAEGYKAKYITGSGESILTRDRVLIFRVEGDCKPIRRAPRNRSRFGFGLSRRASKRAKSNGMNDATVLQAVLELSRKEMGESSSVPSSEKDNTPPMPQNCPLDILANSALSGITHVDYFNGLLHSLPHKKANEHHDHVFPADNDVSAVPPIAVDGKHTIQDTVISYTSRGKVGTKYGGIFKKMISMEKKARAIAPET